MQAFAKNSSPLPPGLSPPRRLPERETACVLRWRAAPVSAPAWPIPPIGCPRHSFRRADGSQGVFPHTVTDRAKPGVIAVNASGRRFVNEALSYHEFVRAMLADGNDAAGRPFHLVCDRQFLWTYGLGRIKPFTWRIRRYVKSGELIEAASIGELADLIGVEESVLTATDRQLQRACADGERSGIRSWHDDLSASPRRRRPFAQSMRRADRAGPFYALRIYPADLGTAVGLANRC